MDTPTPLSLPSINIAKAIMEVMPAASGTANHFDVAYQLIIQNTGNIPLDSLSLIDDLATQLGATFVQVPSLPTIYNPLTTATTPPTINPLFIGATPALDMLLGMSTDQLLPNEQLAIEVVVEVNPSAAGATNPLTNQAVAGGNDPNDDRVEDESDNGADPDGDNGEGGTDDPTLLNCKPAKLSITPAALTICEGESVTLETTSDIAWSMYEWSNQNLSGVVSSTNQNPTFENIQVTTDFVVTLLPTDSMCWTGLTDTITTVSYTHLTLPTKA